MSIFEQISSNGIFISIKTFFYLDGKTFKLEFEKITEKHVFHQNTRKIMSKSLWILLFQIIFTLDKWHERSLHWRLKLVEAHKCIFSQIWKYLWRGFVSDHVLFCNFFKLDFEGLPIEIEENVRSKQNSFRWDLLKNGHSHDFSAIHKNPRIYLENAPNQW